MRKVVWMDVVLVVGLGMIIIGVGINLSGKEQKDNKKLEIVRATPTLGEIKPVLVEMSGEVIRPAVYRVAGDARINDVLVAAGGLSAGADRQWVEENINRAERVADGMKIFIPKINNQSPKSNNQTITNNQLPITKIINLNTATVEQLDSLPGVGPAIGGRIIDYRTKNGGFKNIEEVKLVEGIGEKLFEKIRDLITL